MSQSTNSKMEDGSDIDWSPLKRGGTYFKTHKFVAVDSDTVAFKASGRALIFYWFLLLVGIILLFFGISHGLS